ncbi:MAG: hypothetical protein DRP78_03930 [Candidatus Omnitrophota bacterium]|nr:MAG: hypothetical protein DRP78_03930 [Candidatus Omnitrophota bacterium]
MENIKHSILIIDADSVSTKMFSAILESKGFYVESTDSGKDGMNLLNKGFDIVILDVKLPDMIGTDVLKQLRHKFPEIIIIFVTAYSSVETSVAAVNEGVYAYFIKPFNIDELLKSISFALHKKELDNENKKLVHNTALIYKISKEMEGLIEMHSILQLSLRYLSQIVETDLFAILRYEKATGKFIFGAIEGVDSDFKNLTKRYFDFDASMYKKLVEEHSFVSIVQIQAKPQILEYFPLENPKSLFVFPLMLGAEIIGVVLFAGNKEFVIAQQDMNTILTINSEISRCINNAERYLQVKHDYLGSVSALVKVVEGKNNYFASNSEHVAEFAVRVAAKIGLSADEIELIRFAGLLRDIGKVAISEQLLLKKETLTNEEYMKLKTHCIVSTNIVRSIDKNGKLTPLILYHHECYDGKGYPEGLRGKEIPIGARILSVCDAYEAMTSIRPYRQPLNRANALKELKSCAGTQFDPEIVDIFIETLEYTQT